MAGGNGIPKFFENYGVEQLQFLATVLVACFSPDCDLVIPALVAGVVGYLIFRNRIKGVYFSIITRLH